MSTSVKVEGMVIIHRDKDNGQPTAKGKFFPCRQFTD